MTDRRIVTIVVLSLAVLAVLSLAGVIALALLDKTIPDPLSFQAGATIGALSAVLVSTRTQPPDPPTKEV